MIQQPGLQFLLVMLGFCALEMPAQYTDSGYIGFSGLVSQGSVAIRGNCFLNVSLGPQPFPVMKATRLPYFFLKN